MKPVNHKFTQVELEQKLEDLQKKSEQKDVFIASVVHDLKNLMVPILTRTEMLQLSIPETKKQELLVQLNKSCYILMDALQKMVNICKDANNAGDFQPAHFNLHNLVIEVIDALEVHYQQKNINIINLVSETITVFVDRNMMLSILMNLLGNAIKFTNIGGKIEIISEEIEQNIWKISVKDNGIGINEQQMYNLIKKNQYYTTPGTMGESGTGLGLMLCVSQLHRNHSLLEARNNPDGGATFSFNLSNEEFVIG